MRARGGFRCEDGAGKDQLDIDNIVHAAWAPNGTISHQLDDKWTVGLSLNVPFGMITKYDGRWVGSDHGNLSKVVTVTTTPMAAYKVNDKLSVGAGLPIQYVKAKLSNSAVLATNPGLLTADDVHLKGDTVDVGYQLGAMYEFNENARIGVGYRSEINHKLKGDIKSQDAADIGGIIPGGLLNQDISAKLDTPAMFSVGGFYQLNENGRLWPNIRECSGVHLNLWILLGTVSINRQAISVLPKKTGAIPIFTLSAPAIS